MDFKLGPSQLLPEDIKAAQDMKNNANKVREGYCWPRDRPAPGYAGTEPGGYRILMREPAPKSGTIGRRVPARWPGTSDMPVTNSAVRLASLGTTEGV